MRRTAAYEEVPVRPRSAAAPILGLILALWLIVGAIAAGQRNYYSGSPDNCAKTGTIAVTILAGPLNYVGLNPKVSSCRAPQPSK